MRYNPISGTPVKLFKALLCAACLVPWSVQAQSGTASPAAYSASGQGAAAEEKSLADRGIDIGFIYTGDVLDNLHGGRRRGSVYQGKFELSVGIDLQKYSGLEGWNFFANGFHIHNTGRIRRDYVGGVNTIAAIEGVPRTRLSEFWLEKEFADGKANVRFGQLAADVEFFFSGLSAVFLQSDWATITATNMPSGGPAYPLSTPGVRLKLDPAPGASLLVALYNGDPAGAGIGDEQVRNRHGLDFRTSDSRLLMGEAQFRTNQGRDATGLARTLKVGVWSHRGTFNDQRYADDGRLLSDPAGSGTAAQRRHNQGIYAVVEQQVHRPVGGDAESGISLFSRVSSSPSDRNLISLFVDAGIVFAGMIDARPNDKFGASLAYARFSDRVRAFDRDQIAFTGTPGVVRDYEANLEVSYAAQVTSAGTVQPVVTWVRHPSGDASRNALVAGVRTIWRF